MAWRQKGGYPFFELIMVYWPIYTSRGLGQLTFDGFGL